MKKTPQQGHKRKPPQGGEELERAEQQAKELGGIDEGDCVEAQAEKLVGMLEAEPWDKEDQEDQRFVKDLGQWWPNKEVDRTDHKELDGLWSKRVFVERCWGEIPPGAQT